MKIGISSAGRDMNSLIDPRFGRCAYFMITQTDDDSFEVVENEYKSLGGGAGIQAAGFLQSKGVKAVLTGNCGPNAMKVFSESNIQVVTGQSGIIKDIIETIKKGELTGFADPTVSEKAGPANTGGQKDNGSSGWGRCMGGPGRGLGRGVGTGRGMGGGGGRGMGDGRGSGSGYGRGQV